MKLSDILMTGAMMTLTSCVAGNKDEAKTDIIGPQHVEITDGRMTPEALWAFGRIGGVAVSPDNKQIVYSVAYYSVAENKSNRDLYISDVNGKNRKALTHSVTSEHSATWIQGGQKIAFIRGGQVWTINPDGTDEKQLTSCDKGIEGFIFSPDEKKLLLVSEFKTVESTADKYPDLPQASGLVINDLMYKHWDQWTTGAPQPVVCDYDGEKLTNFVNLLGGTSFESPMRPFGGMEQLCWSPDSKQIAYTCRKLTGKAYAESTNSDIYVYDLKEHTTKNITEGNMGYDTNPAFSPDGKYIAWQSMERDGYESDQNRLFVMNVKTGEKRFVSKSFESNVDTYVWGENSQNIYFIGPWHGTSQIYQVNLDDERVKPITAGQHDYASLAMLGHDKLVAKRHSMSAADEIFVVSMDGTQTQISHENASLYKQLTMGKVEERWINTTDGKKMLTWVIYPPHFDPNKKYPTLLYCQGGPQSPVSQFWSYRWNFQIMAAHDYIIVAPNRRGLPGFGNEWNEAISGDYSGQCMKDYLSAIDTMSEEPFVDKDHLGCVGASFGGFSVYWLAGHHQKRFKAFIAHDGIFNMEQQYLETEEMWFANWDMGGAYWDKNNTVAQRTFANSPHKFVDKWDTPILCIHGEKDYRILASQGMSAFNAAVLRGIPAELLIYPDENHWVLKPQNGILWQRTFFTWLDKWLKK